MRSYQVDMCNGPILKKLIVFALPLILGLTDTLVTC